MAENEGKSSKKLDKPKYEDLDQAILSWFHQQRQDNFPISGPILKAKAENFIEELGLTSFKASEGWLQKLKQRLNIKYVWSKLTEKYTPSDIFNTDEAGIFFFKLQIKLKFKGEKCAGGKFSKEHVTVLVAANMDGTQKKSRWGFISNLQNIELAFLPPNKTSVLQPMNQSVIKSLKGHYRRKLLMELVESEENFQTYIEVDDCLLTMASLTDKEILNSVRKTADQQQGDEEDETDEPELPHSIKKALEAAKLLEKYYLFTKMPQYCKI
ncbi:Tigger transposable element-derived protein 6 [Eumeta japonica]|uniref:Tigger transposable element-derived protein 6 n=1 Tax=Eumeta variegata TaxID=151549 RepID=A0A4C1UA05_EUMVA|nr:Tigger transposable element-derived protein 6 [Eumeta japonica]